MNEQQSHNKQARSFNAIHNNKLNMPGEKLETAKLTAFVSNISLLPSVKTNTRDTGFCFQCFDASRTQRKIFILSRPLVHEAFVKQMLGRWNVNSSGFDDC